MQTTTVVRKTSARIKVLALLRNTLMGDVCMAAETLAAMLFFLLGQEIAGAVAFVFWISLKLVLCSDTFSAFHPFLLVGLMVLRLYDSYDLFMGMKYLLGVPAVLAVLFHFFFYKKKPKKGKLTRGYLALSVALSVGGLFSLPAAHYFSGTALYYTYGLGFGMLLLYSLFLRGEDEESALPLAERVTLSAVFCGLFSVFIVAVQYLLNLELIADGWRFAVEKLSSVGNNLSTSILLTMPFCFFAARKGGARGGVAFFTGVAEGIAAAFSLSRGGLIFGLAMCVFLIFHTLRESEKTRPCNLWILAGMLLACGTVGILFFGEIAELFREGLVVLGKRVKALFFAGAILCLLLTAYARYLFDLPQGKKKRAHLAAVGMLGVLGVILFAVFFDRLKPLLVRADYYRGNMMIIAAKNFGRYPIFGTGIGYRGLREVYPNKQGMFGCYHCLPVQIVGSMGLVGAAAYLFMFHARVTLLRQGKPRDFCTAVFLSYAGILWISLVDPGIFCPVVYGVQLAVYFVAAEKGKNFSKSP